jgi:diguanylate cyclase (GGDEF)-like protein/PAS domain S-box-containing protein
MSSSGSEEINFNTGFKPALQALLALCMPPIRGLVVVPWVQRLLNVLEKKLQQHAEAGALPSVSPTLTLVDTEEDQLLDEQMLARQAKWEQERLLVLRVYNYFRIVVSFSLLILFYQGAKQGFVGSASPAWFQSIALLYLMFNIGIGFASLLSRHALLRGQSAMASIVIFDIFFLSLLLVTSGGVDSGLGYLLVFSVAFGSVMLGGQISFLFPALATVNGISGELYLHNTGQVGGSQHFFEIAMLGMSFFVVNFFFQYISRRLEEREMEVVNLETLDQLHRIAERSRKELELANARFTVLLTSTGEGVLGLDMRGTITFANPRACALLAINYKELIGSDVQRFMVPRDLAVADAKPSAAVRQKILELLSLEQRHVYDSDRWQTADGDAFFVEYSCEATVNKREETTGAVLLFRNISQERANADRLQFLASFDELTGIANRASFNEVLKSAIARSRWSERTIGILIVDNDHFSVINEQQGQAVGDAVLKVMAERLQDCVRQGDLVARLHGDQFAVMLADLDQAEHAAVVAESILAKLAAKVHVKQHEISVSASIGIAVLGTPGQNANELVSAAISALDTAKAEGRNTYRFFNLEMQQRADDKKRVQILLRTAVDNNEFTMMYQPIISLQEQRIQSCEALIRWSPAGLEPIRPDIFIPIAEDSGQINHIGSWVLTNVADQMAVWQTVLGHFPPVALNISSKQLRDSVFRELYLQILETHQIPIGLLELELTETGVMEDPEQCLAELVKLHDLGARLSIDDFGTGYSSLDYLRRLPMDILKIDQSFTGGIGQSENDEEIVRVMIRMAHAMGLEVICEGVETRAQLDFLVANHCDLAQGYYFSRPKSVADMTAMLLAERDTGLAVMEGDI